MADRKREPIKPEKEVLITIPATEETVNKSFWGAVEEKYSQYAANRDWLEIEIMRETQSPEPNIERLAMLKQVIQALKMNGDSQQALIDKARDYQFWGNKGNLDDEIQRERIKLIAKLDEQIENG